jgi:1,2-diacylglycerol 3-alpha-glucosyltransferase/glucuronosyltransferase
MIPCGRGGLAAFPVPGPLDILGVLSRGTHGGEHLIGALDEDLGRAVGRALRADRKPAAREALNYGWDRCSYCFLAGLAIGPAHDPLKQAA